MSFAFLIAQSSESTSLTVEGKHMMKMKEKRLEIASNSLQLQ